MASKKQKNKQRVTLLTPKEGAAANPGGLIDTRIPEPKLRAILAKQTATTLDADVILTSLANAMGSFRFGNEIDSNRLEPAEQVNQAHATAAVITELITRLENMDPTVRDEANTVLWPDTRQFVSTHFERIKPDLCWLLKATTIAAGKIEQQKNQPGRKPKLERNELIRKTYLLLQTNSTPQLTNKSARALTRALLECCGVRLPASDGESDRELQKIISGSLGE